MAARSGDNLDSVALARDLVGLSRAYAQQGFAHARAWPAEFRIQRDSLLVGIAINEGPRVIINAIMFRGNRTTKPSTARRIAAIDQGATFSNIQSERAKDNLERCGLFRSVGAGRLTPAGPDQPGQEDLVFSVRERPYHSFFGAMGYSKPDDGGKGWLSGLLDLGLDNIAGTARAFRLKWERPRQQNSRLEIAYTEPWLLGYGIAADVLLNHRVEDSTYTQSIARLVLKVPLAGQVTAGFGGSLDRVVPGTSQSIRRSLTYSSHWSLAADLRGTGAAPSGVWGEAALDYGRKTYYSPSASLTVSRLSLDLEQRMRVLPGQHLYAGAHGRAVVSSERPVPRPDQYSLGGARSLRGYFEEQFVANQVAWATVEYQLVPQPRLWFYPFLDAGYFFDGNRGLRGVRAGYGVGLRVGTGIGQLDLDYGLGRDDRPLDGKVHLSLRTEF